MRLSSAIRAVAVLEAAKGAMALLVGFGLLSLLDADVRHFIDSLLAHARINPAVREPGVFLQVPDRLTGDHVVLIAAGVAAYAGLRFTEAYGLWLQRQWAEWIAALSGSIYIPFELIQLYHRITWLSLGILLVNAAIVAFMVYSLVQARRTKGESS
jgi:uncharacterized membrane protein (DUF2068 family)